MLTLRDWTETKLWKHLSRMMRSFNPDIRATVNLVLPEVQSVLTQGGTPLQTFTLHDSQHSFRVAERMYDLVPKESLQKLSVYELTLLLLSAYLHDIGMSPEPGDFARHAEFLLASENSTLTPTQRAEFEAWIDEMDAMQSPSSNVGPAGWRRAMAIVADYFRDKHVIWADRWMQRHLCSHLLGDYLHWVSDLRSLCASHHDGLDSLLETRFDPKLIDSRGSIVHLRYLAAVLRIADILEFDPERTPRIILEHREIDLESAIYWHKDHYIALNVEDGQVSLFAEPPTATIHRAVEVMSAAIEDELRIVNRLSVMKPFDVAPFALPVDGYRWTITPYVRTTIRPYRQEYEYIDGSFRPNSAKLVQLLSGIELYGDSKAAIREFLQNAFDAVRELIALERLSKDNPADGTWVKRLANTHRIKLSLIEREGHLWVVCDDDGSGMSKRILTNYFLVSGLHSRNDIRRLERKCQAYGFDSGRTAAFGIGVLSYFMIADEIKIETRRTPLAEDYDDSVWSFTTTGVDDFGELRRSDTARVGTKLELRLKDSIVTAWSQPQKNQLRDLGAESFEHSGVDEPVIRISNTIREYINEVLVHAPCPFVYDFKIQPQVTQAGWCVAHTMKLNLLTIVDEDGTPIGPWASADFDAKAQWVEIDGSLPNDMGSYRILIPVFDYGFGWAPAYCRLKTMNAGIAFVPVKSMLFSSTATYFERPEGTVHFAWKGMKVFAQNNDAVEKLVQRLAKHGVFYVDLRHSSAGMLSASRETISLSASAIESIANLEQVAIARATEFAQNSKQIPSLLWELVIGNSAKRKKANKWLFYDITNFPVAWWRKVPPYFVDEKFLDVQSVQNVRTLTFRGVDVPIAALFSLSFPYMHCQPGGWSSSGSQYESLNLSDHGFQERLVRIAGMNQFVVTKVWSPIKRGNTKSVCFPRDWRTLLGVFFVHNSSFTGWYSNNVESGFDLTPNPVFLGSDVGLKQLILEEMTGYESYNNKALYPDLSRRRSILATQTAAYSWLAAIAIDAMCNKWSRLWAEISRSEDGFVNELWNRYIRLGLQGESSERVYWLLCHTYRNYDDRASTLLVLSRSELKRIETSEDIERLLVDRAGESTLFAE